MLAALHDSPEVVQLLLVNGAKSDITDKHNQTALDIARTHGKSKVLHEPGLRDPEAYVKSYFEGEAEDKARWLETEEGKLQDMLTDKIEQMTRDVMSLTEKRLKEIHDDYERRRREEMEAEAERRLAEWKEKRMLEAEEANAKLELMKQEQEEKARLDREKAIEAEKQREARLEEARKRKEEQDRKKKEQLERMRREELEALNQKFEKQLEDAKHELMAKMDTTLAAAQEREQRDYEADLERAMDDEKQRVELEAVAKENQWRGSEAR